MGGIRYNALGRTLFFTDKTASMRRSFCSVSVLATAAVLAAWSAGCKPSTPLPEAALVTHPGSAKIDSSRGKPAGLAPFAEPPADNVGGGQLVEETWDAISIQAARVGFVRTTIANV